MSSFALKRLGLSLAAGAIVLIAALVLLGSSSGGGPRWRLFGLKASLVHSIALSNHDTTLFAGTGTGLSERENGGPWNERIHGDEIWSVTADGRMVMAAGQDGRVFVSRDGGNTWHRDRLTAAGGYAVSIDPWNPAKLLFGAGGGIYLSSNSGRNWHRVRALGDNASDAFLWINRTTIVTALVSGGKQAVPAGVLISRDTGGSWSRLGGGLPAAGVMSLLLVNQQLLAGTMGESVWKDGPAGSIWTRSSSGMPQTGDHGAALLSVPGSQQSLYVGTLGFGVYHSQDGGKTWDSVSNGLGPSAAGRIILSLAFDRKSRSLLAGTAEGIYRLRM